GKALHPPARFAGGGLPDPLAPRLPLKSPVAQHLLPLRRRTKSAAYENKKNSCGAISIRHREAGADARYRPRDTSCPSFGYHHATQDSLPATKEGAERREAHPTDAALAQTSVRSLRHSSAARQRALWARSPSRA